MKRLTGVALILALAGAAPPALAVTATGTLTATIVRPISVARNSQLSFGKIVRPSSGSETAILSTAGARSFTGAGAGAFWLLSPASTVANFTVSGEGAQQFTLTIDSLVTMNGPGSNTLAVTTSNDAGCPGACALGGSLGGAGTKSFNVGGSFPLTNTTASGAYSGTLHVTATYN